MTEGSTGEYSLSRVNGLSGYTELRGENQRLESKREWSTEQLLTEYVKCTDGIIGRMDGTIPSNQVSVLVHTDKGLKAEVRDLQPPSSVIFLDKSARPIEWLVRKLWPILARVPGTPVASGLVPKKPNDFYLNIDKEDWLRRMGVPEHHLQNPSPDELNFGKIPREEITRIRALYSVRKINEDNLEEAWNHPTIFDGQHVMIVDEVKSSGRTLDIAKWLLSAAIPDALFSGQFWAKPPRIPIKGAVANENEDIPFRIEWVPVWYNGENASGRGIGDRDPSWPENVLKKQGLIPTRHSQIYDWEAEDYFF